MRTETEIKDRLVTIEKYITDWEGTGVPLQWAMEQRDILKWLLNEKLSVSFVALKL